MNYNFPCYTAETCDSFLEHLGLPATQVFIDGVMFQSLPLKTGKVVNLIGLATANVELLKHGIVDQTDHIHPHIRLKSLFFQAEHSMKLFELVIGSHYPCAPAGNPSSWDTQALEVLLPHVLVPYEYLFNTTRPDATVLDLEVSVSGHIDCQTGETCIDGQVINHPHIKIVGYTLDFALDNANKTSR